MRMNVEKLRQKAKEAGIRNWHNKKPENLKKELKSLNKEDDKPSLNIGITEKDNQYFKAIGLKAEWLASLANQYGFTRFQYIAKFKAFRCYIEGKHVDWIDINDLALLNGEKKKADIKLRHQAVSPSRQVIKLPWRDSTQIKINDPSMR